MLARFVTNRNLPGAGG